MRLVDIRTYPVKGLRGGTFDHAQVEPWGLAGDRRWMLIDEEASFVTQRTHPMMALIGATATSTGVTIMVPGEPPLDVPFPTEDAEVISTTLWTDTVPVRLAGEAASALLSRALGVPCRLVWLHDPVARATDPAFAPSGSTVNLSDGFPVLLASMESLADLNRRLPAPITMGRFRPNLVIEGASPWAEDGWRRIRVGEVVFSIVKPCDRCLVTTIDPETGERPDKSEPRRTRGRFRRALSGGVMFAQNLVPENNGRISVGDAIEVLEAGMPNAVFHPEEAEVAA